MSDPARVPRLLLLLAGSSALVLALAYNELLLGLLDPTPPLAQTTRRAIRVAQLLFVGAGLFFCGLSWVLGRSVRFAEVVARPLVSGPLLLLLLFLSPLAALEVGLRPFAQLRAREFTTIYVRDHELGWAHRAGAEDRWAGVHVSVNSKGLRGPELPYRKPPGAVRILFLGDSLTFGDGLELDDTYPALAESLLRRELGREVQAINAGVSGYSPWQEHLYLAREGLRYEPDLVIVGFVLNDVTEKFRLLRFGGSDEGWQLGRTAATRLGAFLASLSSRSAIIEFAQRAAARLRFGRDVQQGARREERLDVEALARDPDRPDVQRAWELTLDNLGDIVDLCEREQIPLALLVFPYAFQLEDPRALSAPQQRIRGFADERGVPMLDLLPVLVDELETQDRPLEDYFSDDLHLRSLGSDLVARHLADFLLHEALPPRDPRAASAAIR